MSTKNFNLALVRNISPHIKPSRIIVKAEVPKASLGSRTTAAESRFTMLRLLLMLGFPCIRMSEKKNNMRYKYHLIFPIYFTPV